MFFDNTINFLTNSLSYIKHLHISLAFITAVLTVQFSQITYFGSEESGVVPVTLLLGGGTSSIDITITVTPSDQSPVSAEGKRCVFYSEQLVSVD